jgi:hypothetical protein
MKFMRRKLQGDLFDGFEQREECKIGEAPISEIYVRIPWGTMRDLEAIFLTSKERRRRKRRVQRGQQGTT